MNPTNPHVFILRGLPGTGIPEFAKFLYELLAPQAVVLASDDYFATAPEHKFDQTKMQEAHKWNFQRFKDAIQKAVPYIIIANSNIKRFHYYHYVDYAQKHNYTTVITLCPHNDSSNRELANKSSIDQDVIRRMRASFEWSMEEINDKN